MTHLVYCRNDGCEYCIELDGPVAHFADSAGMRLFTANVGIIDEDGIEQVPGLYCNDPRVNGMAFIGRFCLEALQYHLYKAK